MRGTGVADVTLDLRWRVLGAPGQHLNRFGGHASCSGASVLALGAGHAAAARGYRESDTVLLAGVCGPAPTDAMFTWAKAKKFLHIR